MITLTPVRIHYKNNTHMNSQNIKIIIAEIRHIRLYSAHSMYDSCPGVSQFCRLQLRPFNSANVNYGAYMSVSPAIQFDNFVIVFFFAEPIQLNASSATGRRKAGASVNGSKIVLILLTFNMSARLQLIGEC